MTEADYSRLFADLAAIAPRVNNETDGASLVVNRVERYLQDHSIGVPAEVRTSFVRRSPNVSDLTLLAFERHAGRFRIVVKTVRQTSFAEPSEIHTQPQRGEASEVASVIPWNDAPRETKLAVYPALPTLLVEIYTRAEKLASSAAEASSKIDALLTSLATAPQVQPSSDPNFKFAIGQAVSTVRKMSYGLLDLCCAGRIVERDLRGVGGVVAHYRLGVQREHWHPEDEVFRGDGATGEANRVNNSRGRRARATSNAPAELASVLEEILDGTSLRTPAFNAAVETARELKRAGADGAKSKDLGVKAMRAVELVDKVLAEDEAKKSEAERMGVATVFETVGLATPSASELSDFRRRLAGAASDFKMLVLEEPRA